MKHLDLITKTVLSIVFLLTINLSYGATLTGPSDATSPPPTDASMVGKVMAAGATVSITGPQDANNADFAIYHWYKLDASGNKQATTVTSKTYTEVTTAPGYYNYELVTENSNGCTSTISDEFQVYVLPVLAVTISTQNNTVCSSTGTTQLTANATTIAGLKLNYQWTRNGVNISGGTTNTYSVSGESAQGSVVFGVLLSYALNTGITGTANQTITVVPLATKPVITAN